MKILFISFGIASMLFAAFIVFDVAKDDLREKTLSTCVLNNKEIKPCMSENGYKNYKYPYN
jgi:hypothetical protein